MQPVEKNKTKNNNKKTKKLQLQVASLEKCRAIKLIFFVFLLENNFSNQFAFLTWDRLSSLNTVISHTAGCHPSVCNFPIRQDVIPQHGNFPYGRQYGRMSSLNMQISHTSGCHPSNTTTDIVNFPFLDGDIPRRILYGVYILDSPEHLQILVTLTAVIKPLLPNF